MAFLEMKFYSEELKKQTMVNVILPDARRRKEGAPIKTLYLLHGLSDNHSAWRNNSNIEKYVHEYGVAVVMPDVGRFWYTDTVFGENYFTYLTKELPRACKMYFGLSDRREDNFIAGLSMGGYGAVKAALWCPESYAGCVSLSGSLDITRKNRPCDLPLWKAIFNPNMESPLELEGTKYDLFHVARENKKNGLVFPKIFLWCGTEDSLITPNRDFSALLDELCVEHVFRESEGDHSWKWWDLHIRDGIEFLFGDLR
ncbi:MAG: esterase family protein [Clostridia bacterium]|nr:esterase family protein [Clostridia bacterium]